MTDYRNPQLRDAANHVAPCPSRHPGIPYHVTRRGNRRGQTFFQDSDFAIYRDLLAQVAHRADTQVLCLLPDAQSCSFDRCCGRCRRSEARFRRRAPPLQRFHQRPPALDRRSMVGTVWRGGDRQGASRRRSALCVEEFGAGEAVPAPAELALVKRRRALRGR